jgi:ribulose-phosphate 3-epimerase
MSTIVPAIIPRSYADLAQKLALLEGVCEEVQVDIVDGRYAGPASWPYVSDPEEPKRFLAEGRMLASGTLRVEIDLMTEDPEMSAGTWIELGASRLAVHAASTRFIPRLLDDIGSWYGHDKEFAPGLLSVGLALGADADTAIAERFLDRIDYVQFMGVRTIGRQGEPFDMGVIPRIRAFRKKHPKIPVQVDGGVTMRNAPALLDAGVSRLVVGSAIWKAPDPLEAYRAFAELTEEHGLYQ